MSKAVDPELGSALIPKERYTSPEFMQLEWERMWTRVWLVAGRESDIPKPGDYMSFELGPESLLIVRQRDRSISALYNVCQHRGNRLCEPGRAHAARFACRFHGWVYGIDGSLELVTDIETFPQGVPKAELALRPVRCESWGGFVWINMNPKAEPLAEFLGVIPEHLDPYRFEEQSITSDLTLEIDCNWKTCVDAFNEAYHVQSTHPELMQYSDDVNVQVDCYERHSRFLYRLAVMSPRLPNRGQISEPIKQMFLRGAGIDPDAFEGGVEDVRPAIARSRRERIGPRLGVDFFSLNDDQLVDDYHYTIFPNLTLNITAAGAWVFRHRPHPSDPNKMLFDFVNLTLDPKSELKRPGHEQHPASEYSFGSTGGGEVLDQDMYNLPRVQAGMNSRAYRGLFLGSQELRIRHFHRTLEDYLGTDPASRV